MVAWIGLFQPVGTIPTGFLFGYRRCPVALDFLLACSHRLLACFHGPRLARNSAFYRVEESGVVILDGEFMGKSSYLLPKPLSLAVMFAVRSRRPACEEFQK